MIANKIYHRRGFVKANLAYHDLSQSSDQYQKTYFMVFQVWAHFKALARRLITVEVERWEYNFRSHLETCTNVKTLN